METDTKALYACLSELGRYLKRLRGAFSFWVLLPGGIGELRSEGWRGHSGLSLYPLRASLQAGEASPTAEAS
jgi:hypothetical protein